MGLKRAARTAWRDVGRLRLYVRSVRGHVTPRREGRHPNPHGDPVPHSDSSECQGPLPSLRMPPEPRHAPGKRTPEREPRSSMHGGDGGERFSGKARMKGGPSRRIGPAFFKSPDNVALRTPYGPYRPYGSVCTVPYCIDREEGLRAVSLRAVLRAHERSEC